MGKLTDQQRKTIELQRERDAGYDASTFFPKAMGQIRNLGAVFSSEAREELQGVNHAFDLLEDGFTRALEELTEDGVENGMKVRDGQREQAYQSILRPVLDGATELMNMNAKAGGWSSDLRINVGARSETIDMNAMDSRLCRMVNSWLEAVDSDRSSEMSNPALPLAVNHEARSDLDTGISRISEVTHLTAGRGWEAKGFVGQAEAARLDRSSAPALVGATP